MYPILIFITKWRIPWAVQLHRCKVRSLQSSDMTGQDVSCFGFPIFHIVGLGLIKCLGKTLRWFHCFTKPGVTGVGYSRLVPADCSRFLTTTVVDAPLCPPKPEESGKIAWIIPSIIVPKIHPTAAIHASES